jgi:hypothetical protein
MVSMSARNFPNQSVSAQPSQLTRHPLRLPTTLGFLLGEQKRCQERMALPTVSNIRTFHGTFILNVFASV